jgi:hypothetical protein
VAGLNQWLMSTPVGVILLSALGCVPGLLLIKALSVARNGFGSAMGSSWVRQGARVRAVEIGLRQDKDGRATMSFLVWHLCSALILLGIMRLFLF